MNRVPVHFVIFQKLTFRYEQLKMITILKREVTTLHPIHLWTF